MTTKIFYDTETCGLHGMAVLIQYKILGTSEIFLWSPWTEKVSDTLELIEWMMEQENIGFNLAFDHFHLCKLYTIWRLLPKNLIPEDDINLVVEKEPLGRDGLCLKPAAACDLMLHARRGKYQKTMQRKDIKIKKIHASIAYEIRDYLEQNVKLDDIYFVGRKNRWIVTDSEGWKDIVLKFKSSSSLKTLAEYALGYKAIRYKNLPTPPVPNEVGYAPFASGGNTWPSVIRYHISFWNSNPLARKYATDDVIYTYELWKHLGSPEPGDDDSELACMVGANRWRGYAIDINKINALIEETKCQAEAAPKAPNNVKRYLLPSMTEEEKLIFETIGDGSTKKTILEEISTWEGEVGIRAKACLQARQAKYKLDLLNKLKMAGRFHVSAEIIGALSGRKSGRGGDLNSQGIGREQAIRECFPLALPGMVLCGGDFEAFEVVLAIAVYGDAKLEAAVRSGKKIHALFGMHCYPDMSYEEILADKEKYTRSKSAVFAMIYGGEAYTLQSRLGVGVEEAEKAYNNFLHEYPSVAVGRERIKDMFCSMQQPNGIGSRVYWHEPVDYISTLFGFKRYFTVENQVCKALFELAQKPPSYWGSLRAGCRIKRRDREQTMLGAIQSALYAAAFAIQAANTRAAGNHVIQGSGAQITKHLERRIWDMQPSGIGPWIVQPMNEHDEIMAPCVPSAVKQLTATVAAVVEKFKSTISLISIDWHSNLKSWADK